MKNQAEKEAADFPEFADRIEQALALILPKRSDPYSIQEKADALGFSKTFMADMLKGKKIPSAPNIMRIAERAGVRAEWLWTGRPPMTEKLADGFIYVGDLAPHQRDAMLQLVKSYSK